MQKIFFTITLAILLVIKNFAQAQQGEAAVRKIKNLAANSTISIRQNTCYIEAVQSDSASMKSVNGVLVLVNKSDSAKQAVMALTIEQASELRAQYDTMLGGKLKNLSLLEMLANRAKLLGGSMKLVADASNTTSITSTHDENFEDPSISKKQLDWPWWWIPIAALAALPVGFFLGKKKSTAPPTANNENIILEATPNAPQDAAMQIALQQQISELKKQLDNAKDFDAAYYHQLLTNYLEPFKKALQQGNTNTANALAAQVAVHAIALCHYKTQRMQGSDEYNIHAMMGNDAKANAIEQKIINTTTSNDAIPTELHTLKQIIANHGTSNHIAYIGYKLLLP